MTEFPLSEWDARRLDSLYQLEILDTAQEKDYDHIVSLAAQVCNCPIATLGFLDEGRTWYKAAKGLTIKETPRHEDYKVGERVPMEPIIIEDTLLDPRSAHHPLVVNAPFVRSVIIFPLITEQGYPVGHLSVADIVPGRLNSVQYEGLEMLVQQTMSLLKLRLQIIKMRRIESQSRRTLDQISPVFNNAIDAVIVTDTEGRIMQWNPRATEMFGWTPEEAVGSRFQDLLIPKRNHHLFWEQMMKVKKKSGTPGYHYQKDILVKRHNNSDFLTSMGVTHADIDGQPVFIGFFSDLTERKQMTRELDKQKTFYENILNKIPTDIAVFNADHKYLFVNPFGIKNPELRKYIIGKDDFEYAEYRNHDTALAIKRRAQFLKAKITGNSVSWEDQAVNADGKTLTHLRRFFPVQDEHGRLSFVIGFGIDITERKVWEQQQDILVERLSFQNTQLFDFCNIVTHNLRGPLANMSMLVEFIEDSDDPEEQRELVSKLRPVISSLTSTFDQLVETIQIKQDLEIKSERVDLQACIDKILEGLDIEMKGAQAKLVIECDDAPEIKFPPKYVHSIFHNLISNALKYRSPDRELVIRVSTRRQGGSVFLSVADNGLGIDMDKHRDNVFKIGKVFHAHANAKGLGLYMTRTQVEVMGGTIQVESEVDKGSTFTIEFRNQQVFASQAG